MKVERAQVMRLNVRRNQPHFSEGRPLAKDHWDWQERHTDGEMPVPYGLEQLFWVWFAGTAGSLCSLGVAVYLWRTGSPGGAAIFLAAAVAWVVFLRWRVRR